MTMRAAALAFFKAHKTSYYYSNERITFSCFRCGEEANMTAFNTAWECQSCQANGNLSHLLKMVNEIGRENRIVKAGKIYNPRKEKNQIHYLLSCVIGTTKDKAGIQKLNRVLKKVDELYEYFVNQKTHG